ncbi:MAG: penicillin-binding protein 2 [Methylococcales bacterium]|jgi:penicillin-binding protein 2|nr:penicillin-binding protein 2 [Methylococcales bacterium]MBT7409848.1 penicillin-binding protein 2 [Methylococcales bacterium]
MIQNRIHIKDNIKENQLFINRAAVGLIIICILLFLLILRLIHLQVSSHQLYTTLSDDNRVKITPIQPTRGLIYDRNGILLAENLTSYSLEIIPEKIKSLDSAIARLKKIISISDHDISLFKKNLKQKRRFKSIPIRFRLSETEVARYAVHRHEFTGIDIKARLDRHYPLGELTAHVLGYVGRINKKELKKIDPSNYAGTSHIGKSGIEKSYEKELHGLVGLDHIETNAVGRTVRVLNRKDPIPGKSLKLHLDIHLQKTAIEALNDFNGAAVAIDIESGGILVFASTPSYNPNLFVNGIQAKKYRALNHSPNKPLFNRALKGQYPPGSTVKPFIALAGLDHEVTTPEQRNYCPGYFSLPDNSHRYRCWKKVGHGSVDLKKSIAQSCDVYFYNLAITLGIDKMQNFMNQFGFGEHSGIDIYGERSGLMPSRKWKRRVKKQVWFPGESVNTGIGQGFMLATPLQLASAVATLARKGKRISPRLVNEITGHSKTTQIEPRAINTIKLNHDDHWQAIFDSMIEVSHGKRGTARKIFKDVKYIVASKTGTAQVFTVAQDKEYNEKGLAKTLRDHALFVAFAPVHSPKIALAIIAENGGHGGSTAGPIAKKILEHYFKIMPIGSK